MPDERKRKLSCCMLAIQARGGALSSCNGMALTYQDVQAFTEIYLLLTELCGSECAGVSET